MVDLPDPESNRPAKPTLDSVDLHILRELRENGRISMAALAEKINLSRASAYNRVELLTRAGIGAHGVVRLPELFDDPYVRATGLRLEQNSEEIGAVTMPGPVVTVNGERLTPGRVANAPGSDARAVLAAIGREDDLPKLEGAWVVQSVGLPRGWPAAT